MESTEGPACKLVDSARLTFRESQLFISCLHLNHDCIGWCRVSTLMSLVVLPSKSSYFLPEVMNQHLSIKL